MEGSDELLQAMEITRHTKWKFEWKCDTPLSGHLRSAAVVTKESIDAWTQKSSFECKKEAPVGHNQPYPISHPAFKKKWASIHINGEKYNDFNVPGS